MTMKAQLTSRERVNRMFNRQDQDRIPRGESFWGETLARWETEGLTGGWGGALDLLGNDFHGLGWVWPCAFPATGGVNAETIVEEDEDTKVVRDGHGKTVRYWKRKSGTPEHLGFDCDTREKWEKIYKPALLKFSVKDRLDEFTSRYAAGVKRNMWTFLTSVEVFEQTRAMIGDEISLFALAEDPEWIEDVGRTFTDVALRELDLVMETGIKPDGLWIYGDMAFKTATMCSPAMYRELMWPQHKRMAEWAHERGMKFIYHTDGDVNGVIDLYIEAGFDCLQPLEAKANMDIRKLCPMYGDKLAFFGNCDVMTYATNDLDRIEAEIQCKLEAGKKTRGYAYHSDHSVPPQVSFETYKHIVRCVEKYGNY
jgi:uroporphyrinogen decarboxylase